MKKTYRAILIIIVAMWSVVCLHAAENDALPAGTSEYEVVMSIRPKGKTTIGFLSSQPLDITNPGALLIETGNIEKLVPAANGEDVYAHGTFYFFVDSSEAKYTLELETTPMGPVSASNKKKGPDLWIKVDGKACSFQKGTAAATNVLKGIKRTPTNEFHKVMLGTSSTMIDQNDPDHWSKIDLKIHVIGTKIHYMDPNEQYKGIMRLVFTTQV